MTGEEVLARCHAAGIVLELEDGHIMAGPAPIPGEIKELVVIHKDAVLALLTPTSNPAISYAEAVQECRVLRAAWTGAAFELAEALDFPRLQFRQHLAVLSGEIPWRTFLRQADVPTLRDYVLPALKAQLSGIPAPS